MLFALFFVLGFALAVLSTVLYRYFSQYTIQQVFFPLRMPFWQTIFAWIGMFLGLVIMAIEIGTMRRGRWRDTWGWRIFLSSLAGWLGSWLAGVITSFVLQLFTGWAVAPPPPEPKP